MASRKLEFDKITGVSPKNVEPVEAFSLPKEEVSSPATLTIQETEPEERQQTSKSPKVKEPEERREKKNFFITSANCLKISLLAKYMGCGPGYIVDMALDRLFSDTDIKEKIRKEMEVDRLKKEVLEKSL